MLSRRKTRYIALLLAAICLLACAATALANSAEPPGITVIVTNPPDDLTLTLRLRNGDTAPLEREDRAWESWFRFFYHSIPQSHDQLGKSTLLAETGGVMTEYALPTDTFGRYNNLLTLDIDEGTVMVGARPMRTPFLITLRVILTLLIEGAVFWLFGYRQRRSWLLFLIANLITQGLLNMAFTGPHIGGYWLFGFILGEILVFAAEMTAFPLLLREHKKSRAILYAAAANLLSLALGGWLIASLPV